MRLFEDDCLWVQINDGDELAFSIFKRHYTFRKWRQRNGKNGKRFGGPGEQIILISTDHKALFVWRKEVFRKDGQSGICCAVFRNEGDLLSSKLILQAEQIAMRRWPQERLFTYVNSKKIRSSNPGYCFKKAGWRQCGTSKAKKLIILEKTNHERVQQQIRA
jgi:hypothetical protein